MREKDVKQTLWMMLRSFEVGVARCGVDMKLEVDAGGNFIGPRDQASSPTEELQAPQVANADLHTPSTPLTVCLHCSSLIHISQLREPLREKRCLKGTALLPLQ